MRRWLIRIGTALAFLFLVLTFINASWLVKSPGGYPKLIAHRGAHQLYSDAGLTRDSCTASKIFPPTHDTLENTMAGIFHAAQLGSKVIEIDIAPTRDGKLAVFHDWTLDCRTNGKGPVRDATMAELKALDAGYGYTADGGKTFPFRGKGIGLIPELGEVLAAFPRQALMFNFKSKDAAEADLLLAALNAAGRDPVALGDGFYGSVEAGPVARMRQLLPQAWVWSKESARACTKAYGWQGWFGMMPDACRGATMMIPLNYQWAFAGWPNRLMARADAAGTRVIVIGPQDDKDRPMGLDLPEQLGEVPATFGGYIWVDDIYTIGPALRPAYNKRNPVLEAELARELDRRRKMRE
ncbi:MAG: glycerophosphodiester phosphodiesterase [Sphingomonadales bacterium]|nr:glycerophosphodiester phosphodiesterase [Sphingomonadales bacterium]